MIERDPAAAALPVDLDGMRHAADEDEGHGHFLQADYLRRGVAEIERLRSLLTRWIDLDGDNDDVAALIAETRIAIND